ncbi:hypothetical protein PPL_11001 [Heterostelium album PN500]|uniref:Uncharacterized protein n=1 Tax=Heterostelium pallidum (strain ATCC 26659 / Pp 5 / PN500) TaxID=670386 RepID=D3BSN2_HETP5|nr:hypothetical protein PPL_11001 [Heterostelium album PN500]EFA75497.1 hypothetical protein PPL_11001 [Heterostelium album PN500]|eukprot:XP_020427631.1 hypothetical protein PPL_11001 [Heterostelium album PN500]
MYDLTNKFIVIKTFSKELEFTNFPIFRLTISLGSYGFIGTPVIFGLSKFVRSIWPTVDQEGIVLGTQFFVFSVIFYDIIDTNELELGIKVISRVINIFKFGKLQEDATPLENIAFDFFQNLKIRVGEQHPLMNLFTNAFIDYFDNLIPWQNMKFQLSKY